MNAARCNSKWPMHHLTRSCARSLTLGGTIESAQDEGPRSRPGGTQRRGGARSAMSGARSVPHRGRARRSRTASGGAQHSSVAGRAREYIARDTRSVSASVLLLPHLVFLVLTLVVVLLAVIAVVEMAATISLHLKSRSCLPRQSLDLPGLPSKSRLALPGKASRDLLRASLDLLSHASRDFAFEVKSYL